MKSGPFAWASDACAVEAAPDLRRAPGTRRPVCFDDVMDALRMLDKKAEEQNDQSARYLRHMRRASAISRNGPPRRKKEVNRQSIERPGAGDHAGQRPMTFTSPRAIGSSRG